jgi:hypothetical protein
LVASHICGNQVDLHYHTPLIDLRVSSQAKDNRDKRRQKKKTTKPPYIRADVFRAVQGHSSNRLWCGLADEA